MDIYELIEKVEGKVEGGFDFLGITIVDKSKIMEILNEIRLNLPRELGLARTITEDCNRVKAEAQMQADRIIKSADERVKTMIDDHEVTKKAYEQANTIVERAKETARDMRLGANQYADEILEDLEKELTMHLEQIKMGRSKLKK